MGKMGLLHSAILNSIPRVKVVAVTETEKLVASFLKNANVFTVYKDYKKMIENESLDLVYITTPVAFHVPIATFCAEKKIYFFIEKPLGRNFEECVTLCDEVIKNKIFTMVGFYLRYSETFSKVKELLENQAIGKITKINSSVYQTQLLRKPSGWRFKKKSSGGGVLIDLGIHLIDLLRWYFGNIVDVKGTIKSLNSQEVEDTANAIIKFSNGLQCYFEASWNVEKYRLQETTIDVEGTHGRILVNEDFIKITDLENHEKILYRQSLHKGVIIDIAGPEYTREDVDFIECVFNGKEPHTNVIDAINNQGVIDAIYKSAQTKNIEKVKHIE